MDISGLPLSELVVAVVSIGGTILGSRLLDRRKEIREVLEKRQLRIRSVIAALSELNHDLQVLENEFKPTDEELPRIARMFATLIQDSIDLDQKKILEWETDLNNAISEVKTIDVALYIRLLGEKKDFRNFFSRILIPYLSDYRAKDPSNKPELISFAIREFLNDLRATILGLSKELPIKERKAVAAEIIQLEAIPMHDDAVQIEIFELITKAIPFEISPPIEEKDLKWLNEKSENPALHVVLDHLQNFLPLLPGLFEKILFGNIASTLAPLLKTNDDGLNDWFITNSEEAEEIERYFSEFFFTDEELNAFVGNKEFGKLLIGIGKRFGFELPFKYRRCLIALQNGIVDANQLIAFLRDNRIPIVDHNVVHTVPFLPLGYNIEFEKSAQYERYIALSERLDGLTENVFFHGMTKDEITECEKSIGYLLPPYFRDFLLVFGVKQDLLPWLNWTDGEFLIAGMPLPEMDHGRFFIVGRRTEFGLFFISFSDPDSDMVYRLDFENGKQLIEMGSLPDLLETAVEEAIANYDSRSPNSEKIRKVELNFYSEDYDEVITPILDHLKMDELPAFEFRELANDVAIWKAELRFEGRSIEIQKHESFDPKFYPKFFLTLSEPITDLKSHSFVDFLRGCYKELQIKSHFLEYDFRKTLP